MRGGIVKSLPFSLPRQLVYSSTGGGGSPPSNLMLTGILPDADEGDHYNAALNISGGTAPYLNPLVISGALPAGFTLTVVGNQLIVDGDTVGLAGVYSGTIQVKDSSGPQETAADPFSFTIVAMNLLATEDGKLITTEDGKFIRVT